MTRKERELALARLHGYDSYYKYRVGKGASKGLNAQLASGKRKRYVSTLKYERQKRELGRLEGGTPTVGRQLSQREMWSLEPPSGSYHESRRFQNIDQAIAYWGGITNHMLQNGMAFLRVDENGELYWHILDKTP